MAFIAPMLASPLKAGFAPKPGEWISEEKYDGIRLIVEVDREQPEDLLSSETVRSWSRDQILHAIPRHLRAAFGVLPTGIYDCELFVPGKRSYGATRLDMADKLQAVVFDVLEVNRVPVFEQKLTHRRALLDVIFTHDVVVAVAPHVTLAEARVITCYDDIIAHRDEVWGRDGEGLILKYLEARYRPGKRDKSWIKIKQLKSAVLTVIGFEPSRGEIINRGPYATVVLQDSDGNVTTVKTRNDAEVAKFERDAPVSGIKHPAIGRALRIEYQERTPDGSYRHPRWDRWEDE
jgi:bifunctional non-homologous end joining protein LigD